MARSCYEPWDAGWRVDLDQSRVACPQVVLTKHDKPLQRLMERQRAAQTEGTDPWECFGSRQGLAPAVLMVAAGLSLSGCGTLYFAP